MKEFVNGSFKHSQLTGLIIGCAIKVHTTIGNGFQEVIYQRCLAIAMEKQGLSFARELEMEIYYEGINVGNRTVDFLVNNVIMVELKATSKLEDVHLAQALNYLEAYKLETGLLLNFGSRSLEVKRLTNEFNCETKKNHKFHTEISEIKKSIKSTVQKASPKATYSPLWRGSPGRFSPTP